jgi:lipopolysaccharide biosynthesis glycosyltransferase
LYFNSGVLLFDLSHPHLVAMLDQAIDFSLNQPEMLTFVDQCALNWAFHDQTCALPSHCNHFLRQNDPMRLFVQDPTVIHFLDRPKPWDPMYRNANCVRWLREFASLGDVTGSQALGELISLSLRPSVRPAQLSA